MAPGEAATVLVIIRDLVVAELGFENKRRNRGIIYDDGEVGLVVASTR